MLKNPLANAGDTRDTRVCSLGQEELVNKEIATHSSIFFFFRELKKNLYYSFVIYLFSFQLIFER